MNLTGLMLPLMVERGGAIINVASTAAFQPMPYVATYGATKSFVLEWSLALREELKEHKIRILALCPGPTRTSIVSIFKDKGIDLGDLQSSEEVVEVAWKALESDKGFVVPGFRNKIRVCLSKLLPLCLVAKETGEFFRPKKN